MEAIKKGSNHYYFIEPKVLDRSHDSHEAVKIMLTHPNIDLNIRDRNGWTALFWAIKKDRLEIVETLLNMTGIDFDIKTNAMEGYATVASEVRIESSLKLQSSGSLFVPGW